MTYEEDANAGFAGEGSVVEVGHDLLGDEVFTHCVEADSGVRVLRVEVDRAVVLLHDAAGPTPVQVEVNYKQPLLVLHQGAELLLVLYLENNLLLCLLAHLLIN